MKTVQSSSFQNSSTPENLIQLDASRKTSNKGEKGEDGDEKKLETIPGKSEWVILLFDIVTGGFGFDSGSGGSGQESRDGLLLLALKDGKTIIEDSFLGLRSLAGLGCFLVVEVRDRFGVDGRVNEDGGDGLSSGSSGDLSSSELEVLGLFSERRVSLALWRRLRLFESVIFVELFFHLTRKID